MVGGPRRPAGFSLVELLVVIAIIATLIALLLPAVQSAREAARRTHCANNLNQLSAGALQHVQAHGYFPSGGWGHGWTGDPDNGFGRTQPGSWAFSVLPYVENVALFSRGAGATPQQKVEIAKEVMATPLPVFNCPSRRSPIAYPVNGPLTYVYPGDGGVTMGKVWFPAAKSCYAANGGCRWPGFCSGPGTKAAGLAATEICFSQSRSEGIDWPASQLPPAAIFDGLSATYLFGEKSLNPDRYNSWDVGGDSATMFGGFDLEVTRYADAIYPPHQDRPGESTTWSFGGPHSGGCQFSFCDGSVRSVDYSIDVETHRRLANRRDREPIDASAL